jgi:glycosyltransferase involved in cell wall biosynthesis
MSNFAVNANSSLVVHSHLRWDFVWQRPQQLLSRFGERSHVLFVEEPVHQDDITEGRLDLSRPVPRVQRVVPVLPGALRGNYDASIETVRTLLGAFMADDGPGAGVFSRPIHWFYTPMPAPAMIGAFNEVAIVYDCMDELSKFRFAPTELVDREAYLMAEADVVFAGGHRLAQAKAKRHRNVHFFGCGVDNKHFGAARAPETEIAPDVAALPGAVAGYYGVVDERIDYQLLGTLAAALPEVSFAMVGPVVKVHPNELPHAPNIHWLGQRAYAELPAIVKGFDVCLMPFALNEATEFINPTKTLEYMAAGKPIVSTAIADVIHNFTPVVSVARTHDEFVYCVRNAVEGPDAEMLDRGVHQARDNSWETIVSRMRRIIDEAIARNTVAPAAREQQAASRTPRADRVGAPSLA